jgi:glycosyltransferase involved in cell wall biosynthesis
MIKVLFISQWYPHRYDQMSGLFVQKHAEAVSIFCNVRVLYVHADENISNFEVEEKLHTGFRELIVYYPNKKGRPFYAIRKVTNYLIAYKKGMDILRAEKFTPDIVHANILTRTGLIAYILKLWKGIPYVVTEHWSRYLPNRNAYNGAIRKLITRIVVKNATAILPVSEILKKGMLSNNLLNNNYIIVSNVVDNNFFENSPTVHRKKKRILHISCFDEQAKNIKGILRATSQLAKMRQDFELILIGTGIDYQSIHKYSDNFNFSKGIVQFLGEKTPEEVANWLKNSDFLLMFSNYETAGVVIAESLVCGKPVLSTKVGAAPEYISETNGRLIDIADESALVTEMNYLLDNPDNYDCERIKDEAQQKFSYNNVGKVICDIYNQSLQNL